MTLFSRVISTIKPKTSAKEARHTKRYLKHLAKQLKAGMKNREVDSHGTPTMAASTGQPIINSDTSSNVSDSNKNVQPPLQQMTPSVHLPKASLRAMKSQSLDEPPAVTSTICGSGSASAEPSRIFKQDPVDDNAQSNITHHKNILKLAFKHDLPFPDYLSQRPDRDRLWRYWRRLHYQSEGAEPPGMPPWLPDAAPTGLPSDVDIVESKERSGSQAAGHRRNGTVLLRSSTSADLDLANVQEMVEVEPGADSRLPGCSETVPHQASAGITANLELYHRSLMKQAFLHDLTFPKQLHIEPDCLELWRYWRFLHHRAGKVLPQRAAPWLSESAPNLNGTASDHKIESPQRQPQVHQAHGSNGHTAPQICTNPCDQHAPNNLQALVETEERDTMTCSSDTPAFDALSFMEGLLCEIERNL